MPPTLDDWRRLYALCDPKHRLRIDELDLFVERPDSVAQGIARIVSLGVEAEGKWLISGSVGAGKSTELTKLASLLNTSHLIIGVDLWQATGNIDDITPAEILFGIAAAAIRAAKVRLAHDIDQAKLDNLEAAFRGLLDRQHEIDLNGLAEGLALFGVDLVAPGVSTAAKAVIQTGNALAGARTIPARRTKLGGLTRPVKEGDAALEALQLAVNDILADIAALRPPLVLVDGLDKINKLDRIREIFATSQVLASPRVPLVYTGPITLMLAAEWSGVGNYFRRERLTNLAVQVPPGQSRGLSEDKRVHGREAARRVIELRCERAKLSIATAFSSASVELLIDKSGGIIRQLLQLTQETIRQVLLANAGKIEIDHVITACDYWRKEFEVTLNGMRREALEYIAEHGEPRGDQISHELLLWNYAIVYANGDIWFDPNPLIDLERRRG